jgi:hypothetical protein
MGAPASNIRGLRRRRLTTIVAVVFIFAAPVIGLSIESRIYGDTHL